MRNSAIIFENWKMKNGFSIFNFESKSKYTKMSFSIPILKWKLNGTLGERIRIIFYFSNLTIELKKEKRKKNFWIYFDLKSNSAKKKLKLSNSLWISKSSFNFQFWLWNWKMKNETFSKFVLFLNQKPITKRSKNGTRI